MRAGFPRAHLKEGLARALALHASFALTIALFDTGRALPIEPGLDANDGTYSWVTYSSQGRVACRDDEA